MLNIIVLSITFCRKFSPSKIMSYMKDFLQSRVCIHTPVTENNHIIEQHELLMLLLLLCVCNVYQSCVKLVRVHYGNVSLFGIEMEDNFKVVIFKCFMFFQA